jgi:hypothetical protein
MINWGIWDVLRLWPVLLIAAGLEILIGQRSALGSAIAATLVLGVIVAGIWLVSTGPGPGDLTSIAYPMDGTDAAYVRLAPAVASLKVRGVTDTDQLIEGSLDIHRSEQLETQFVEGTNAKIILETEETNPLGYAGAQGTHVWDVNVHGDVALDLETNIAIGQIDLDLARTSTEDVDVDFGIAQVEIALPPGNSVDGLVDGGIGTVVIHVPENVGLQLTADTGLVGRNVPSAYARNDNVFTSPNYETAETRIELTISLGIGTLTVRDTNTP